MKSSGKHSNPSVDGSNSTIENQQTKISITKSFFGFGSRRNSASSAVGHQPSPSTVTNSEKPKKLVKIRRDSKSQSRPASAMTRMQSDQTVIIANAGSSNNNNNTTNENSKLQISQITAERSAAAKIYFENYFARLESGKSISPTTSSSRARRRMQMEQELDQMGLSDQEKTKIRQEWLTREHRLIRNSREKISIERFETLKYLGKGAFGRVQLVREKKSGKVYAMKALSKESMLRKQQESHVRAERDMLSEAALDDACQWLVKLCYSFQDRDHLYFVMDYFPGGDLLSLLIHFDIFPEDMARFYAAEMLLCIEETHRLGYVHRDIKPDNFLIDARGHLRLGDCGLATDFHWSHESNYYKQVRQNAYKSSLEAASIEPDFHLKSEKKELEDYIKSTESDEPQLLRPTNTTSTVKSDERVMTWRARTKLEHPHFRTYSVVGTNNYMAQEMLLGEPYDYSCDWWSFGIIVFEMLYGYPPFASKTKDGTRMKIIEWSKWLRFPSHVTRKQRLGDGEFAGDVSREARDLIAQLIADKNDRLGSIGRMQRYPTSNPGFASSYPTSPISPHTPDNSNPLNIFDVMLSGKDAADIKRHPWFKSIDFTRIRQQQAPWQPTLDSDADTRYFNNASESKTTNSSENKISGPYGSGIGMAEDSEQQQNNLSNSLLDLRKKLAFVGFTYKGAM